MICVIFGDRKFTDYSELLRAVKESKFEITRVVNDGSKGSAALAERFAKENKLPLDTIKAEWDELDVPGAVVKYNDYGKAYNSKAGFDANQKLAEIAECAIGLQLDGNAREVQDVSNRMKKLEKPVYILGPKESELIEF